MPTYTYRCIDCGHTREIRTSIAERNQWCWCVKCDSTSLRRIPDAPGFTVTGYNAKNGYSNGR